MSLLAPTAANEGDGTVVIRPPLGLAEQRRSLRLILARSGVADQLVARQVEAMIRQAARRQLCLDLHRLAVLDHRIVASCLALPAPGRTAIILVSPPRESADLRDALRSLLEDVASACWSGGLHLLQALLLPDERLQQELLEEIGFRRLAELAYMRLKPELSARRRAPSRLRWQAYSARKHAVFAETIKATYLDSRDCPGLSGLRDIDDVILGHKATGLFDPATWFVAIEAGEPAGVLLLNTMPDQGAMEVVYMGVCRERRGRGLGHAMMDKAVEVAALAGCQSLTLAVDSTNVAACALYRAHGFAPVGSRIAWISARPGRVSASV